MLIKEVGTFRGAITEHAVNCTSKGLPQWVVGLLAMEKYDYETKQWVDWTACPDNTLTGYLVLFSHEGKATFHVADIRAAVEWDGVSLTGLNNMDLDNAGIQFNVEEHLYEGNTSMKVAKVQPYDATPSMGGVRKMTDDEVKKLDAQFAAQLRKIGGAPKPASAPKPTAPAAPVARKNKPAPAAPKPVTKKSAPKPPSPGQAVEDLLKTPAAEDDAPAAPAAPMAPPSIPSTGDAKETMTKEEAWETVLAQKAPNIKDSEVISAWQKNVKHIIDAYDQYKSDSDLNEVDWAEVCNNVIAETGIPY